MANASGVTGRQVRSRSIRYLILAIAWLPSLVLLSGGMVLAATSVVDGRRIRSDTDAFTRAVPPTAVFIQRLLEERHAAVLYAATPAAKPADLTPTRDAFDAVAGPVRAQFHSLAAGRPERYGTITAQMDTFFSRLPAQRDRIAAHQVSTLEVSTYYSEFSGQLDVSLYQQVLAQPVAAAAVSQTAAVTLLRGIDELGDGDGLAAATFAGSGLDAATYQRFTERLGAARARLGEVRDLLEPVAAKQLNALLTGPAWQRLDQNYRLALQAGPQPTPPAATGTGTGTAVTPTASGAPAAAAGRERILAAHVAAVTPEPKIDPARWTEDLGSAVATLSAVNVRQITYASGRSGTEADAQVRRGLISGGALLLAGVLVLLLTTWASNRLIRRLRNLRADTLTLAREKLPAIVTRLQAGEPVDVAHELPPLAYGSDEIGQVAAAFEEAQRTAVAAAAREAETRVGLRTVFLDIAHRSQAIVYRQLKVLDQAERDQEDPDQLELLFQLDHLATRARRNAENLIILGGGQPGRQWRSPVPLLDIVRSAISEAEDYVRVAVASVPRVEIAGTVVGDLIHLLAELVDNATNFSPPMSRVEVRGNLVGRGLVLEIEDQGLGIEPDQLAELNRVLHEPPEFQVMALAEEPRLGLFVVAQLASRHGVRVTLTPSPAYGGTRVVVLLPNAVLASGDESRVLDGGRPALPAVAGPGPTPGGEPGGEDPEVAAAAQRALEQRAVELRAARATRPEPVVPGALGEWRRPGAPASRGRSAPLVPVPPLGPEPPGPTASPDVPARSPLPVRGPMAPQPVGPGFSIPGTAPRAAPSAPIPVFPPSAPPPAPSPPAAPAPAAPAPPPVPAFAPAGGPGAAAAPPPAPAPPPGRPALPRRNPQTHLSPRLTNDPEPVGPDARPVPELPDAELARSRMSALQRGTMRGRATEPEAQR